MSNNQSSSGIGFAGLLTIVFIIFKLLDITIIATWSWWWVLSPIWITFALVSILIGILGILAYLGKQKIKTIRGNQEPRKSKFMQKLEKATEEYNRNYK